MRIHQPIFVRDLVIGERFFDYNVNVILIKVGSSIKMTDPEDYDKIELHIYQKLEREANISPILHKARHCIYSRTT